MLNSGQVGILNDILYRQLSLGVRDIARDLEFA